MSRLCVCMRPPLIIRNKSVKRQVLQKGTKLLIVQKSGKCFNICDILPFSTSSLQAKVGLLQTGKWWYYGVQLGIQLVISSSGRGLKFEVGSST